MSTVFDLTAWNAKELARVELALDQWVTTDAPAGVDHGAPAELVEAMRYAVLDGGKRLRPLLVLAAHEAVRGGGPDTPADAESALRAATLKFRGRFEQVEALARTRGITLKTAGLPVLDALWDDVKASE